MEWTPFHSMMAQKDGWDIIDTKSENKYKLKLDKLELSDFITRARYGIFPYEHAMAFISAKMPKLWKRIQEDL